MRNYMKHLFIIVVAIIVPTGCAQMEKPERSKQDSETQIQSKDQTDHKNEKLSIVASFYPLAYISERIGNERVDVINIVGALDPHDYTLSPQDLVKMHEADIILLNGASLEPWGEDIVRQFVDSPVTVVEVTDSLSLAQNTEKSEHDDHSSEHEDMHEYSEKLEQDSHGHGVFDPHAWLDPVIAQEIVRTIEKQMISVDQENASMYQENAAELIHEFQALHTAYENALANCAQDVVVVSHDAFGYIANRYGFEIHAIAGLSTQDTPSAQTLAFLKEEVQEGATHILAESTSVKRFAQTLSDETGLHMLSINALAAERDGGDFLVQAQKNVEQFKTALGCQ